MMAGRPAEGSPRRPDRRLRRVFNLSGSEIIVILLLALVVLGPEKLPDALRRAGKAYGELKRMSATFQSEMRSALDEPVKEMRETADLLRRSAQIDTTASAASATRSAEPDADPDPQPASGGDPSQPDPEPHPNPEPDPYPDDEHRDGASR